MANVTEATRPATEAARPARRRNLRALFPWLRRLVFYLALLALWQALATGGIWPDYLFPTPGEVCTDLVNGFQGGGLYLQATLVTLQRLAIGYAISLALGVTLGLLMGRIRLFNETVGSLILGLQALDRKSTRR